VAATGRRARVAVAHAVQILLAEHSKHEEGLIDLAFPLCDLDRSQAVQINDKHIEVICRQMLRSVRMTRVGDTDFLVDEQVDRFRFMEENEKVMNRRGEPADGTPLLLGITKASLSTDSFISAHRSRRRLASSPGRPSPAAISARDALHAAVMLNHGIEWIATFDTGFDRVAGIPRFRLE